MKRRVHPLQRYKKLGIKERTVYKKLRDYVGTGLLKKVKTGVYRKLSKN